MKTFKIEGIVIKRRSFGEADRLVTIFTKTHGKLQVKAAGVRRITSKRAPHIELLNNSLLTLYKGKSIPIVTEAMTLNDFASIKEDLGMIGLAYHICEIVDGLCPENQESRAIYLLLHDTLSRLATATDKAKVIHAFEIALLTHLGFLSYGEEEQNISTQQVIENILERRLKSRHLLSKIS